MTNDEELDAYQIVIAICRRVIDKSRISLRDTQSYLGILLDDNNRKSICRLHLNTTNKYISTFGKGKIETKHTINSIDDIYAYEDALLNTISMYNDM